MVNKIDRIVGASEHNGLSQLVGKCLFQCAHCVSISKYQHPDHCVIKIPLSCGCMPVGFENLGLCKVRMND